MCHAYHNSWYYTFNKIREIHTVLLTQYCAMTAENPPTSSPNKCTLTYDWQRKQEIPKRMSPKIQFRHSEFLRDLIIWDFRVARVSIWSVMISREISLALWNDAVYAMRNFEYKSCLMNQSALCQHCGWVGGNKFRYSIPLAGLEYTLWNIPFKIYCYQW